MKCSRLRDLDLSGCRAITDAAVCYVAENVTGLSSLRLDGNRHVTTHTLTRYLGGEKPLEFAELAQNWLGYQPKQNHVERILQKEKHMLRLQSVVLMQSAVRRKLAFMRKRALRRIWLMNVMFPRAQARVRGVLQRVRYASILLGIRKVRLATKIQSWYRGCVHYRAYTKWQKAKRKQAFQQSKALKIQSAYRRLLAYRRVQDIRNEAANARLDAAKAMTRMQLAAIRIQTGGRVKLARLNVGRRLASRDELLRVRALRLHSALLLQRVVRGFLGRRRATHRREEIAHYWKCWDRAVALQRVYRGHRGRRHAAAVRDAYRLCVSTKAATDLQRAWRGRRGRVLAAVQRALQALRLVRMRGAGIIQRSYRGYKARLRVVQLRVESAERRTRLAAALRIQRVLRGHKGREAAEIERCLLKMEGQAAPLFALLATLEVCVWGAHLHHHYYYYHHINTKQQ